MKWMLTIVFRWRPTNTEWQYKTVITKKPPERWLADRLEAVKIGDVAKMEASILYAREITEEDAEGLDHVIEDSDL